MKKYIFGTIIIGFTLLFTILQSIEAPPGDIGPIIIWSDDITLTENFTVEYYQTLIIQPNVTVYLDKDVSIIINGSLSAEGNENELITFTSLNSVNKYWGSILFKSYSDERDSIIRFANIEYGNKGVWFSGSSHEISNSTIQNCTNGIYIDNPTWKSSSDINPIIKNNVIKNNWNGIWVRGKPEISNNKIISNQYGLNISGFVIWESGIPVIKNNLIKNNHIGIDAWSIWTLVNPTIENNTISFNDIGISLVAHFTGGNASASIANNNITNNYINGINLTFASGNISSNNISFNGGNGIALFCSDPTISYNEITYNDEYGINIDSFSDPILINNTFGNNRLGATNINQDNSNDTNSEQEDDPQNTVDIVSIVKSIFMGILILLVIILIVISVVVLISLKKRD